MLKFMLLVAALFGLPLAALPAFAGPAFPIPAPQYADTAPAPAIPPLF